MQIQPLGERALVARLGDAIDEETHRRVRAAFARLRALALPGVVDLVPAFTSVTVHYDPLRIGPDALAAAVREALGRPEAGELPPPRTVEIPVLYGGERGPDLEEVATRHGLTPEEVVRRHAAGDYLVYMIGFAPGFPYLGGLDERIATPRRDSPRASVPAGSVGIGGSQTGVYPFESPGGWHLIGRTPVRMFDPRRDPPALLSTGDRVRFVPIGEEEYRDREAARA